MIVKILSSSRSFKGVKYNTDKIDRNKGELIKVANFGPLQALGNQKPQDYVNYLKMISAQNKNIKHPQFHVAISTKGRMHSKDELTVIAEKWLGNMGYQNQPYLIVFHKDTRNNHIHIVSTRIDRDGIKISSAFEKNRAIQNLNQVMGLNEELQANKHFKDALSYQFSTKAQLMLILESHNYTIGGSSDRMELIKFGKVVGQFDLSMLNQRIATSKAKIILEPAQSLAKEVRARQLTAIFNKYLDVYSSSLYHQSGPLPGGREQFLSTYTSDFAIAMKQKLGVEIVYHSKDGKLPYGYSVIDHSVGNRYVYKGGEIMDISDLLNDRGLDVKGNLFLDEQHNAFGTAHQNSNGAIHDQQSPVGSFENLIIENFDQSLGEVPQSFAEVENYDDQTPASSSNPDLDFSPSADFSPPSADITIDITDDIDDEGILGRNRRRQKKARTNSR